jgi:hypothetical protein
VHIKTAKEVLLSIPSNQCKALEVAHWRYLCFTGITSIDHASDVQAEADRTIYPSLLKWTDDGRAILSNDRCAEFMSLVSGLPKEWCAAWDEADFCDTHGENCPCEVNADSGARNAKK